MLRNIRLLLHSSRVISYNEEKVIHNLVSSPRWQSSSAAPICFMNSKRSKENKIYSCNNIFNKYSGLLPALNVLSSKTPQFQTFLRYASSTTASQSTGYIFPEGYIPEPPLPPEIINVAPQLNALGEQSLGSLGLGGWWPSGLVQQGLETLHVGLGLPWWGSVVLGTVIIRLCLFPLVIKSQKYMINMNNHMPVIQRLQEKVTIARISGNQMEAAMATYELHDYTKRNNVRPLRAMMMPLIQMPIFLSVFFGLRGMAELPVESMRTGGALWFSDLTIPDAYYGLPLLTSLTLFITLEVGSDSVRTAAMAPMMRWVMRLMPVVIFPFIMNFPAAMCCYWFTANVMSLLQALLLRIPALREYFGIPQMVTHPPKFGANKKGFIEGFKDSMENSKLLAKVQDRERIEATKFREAGMGPIQKTYSYDPTKVKVKDDATKTKVEKQKA